MQARLQLQQSGSWAYAAYAARAVPFTEHQIETSRQLARSCARPLTNCEDLDSWFSKAANTAATAAAAAAAVHGIPGTLLRKMHAAAVAAEGAAVCLQDGICKQEMLVTFPWVRTFLWFRDT